MDIFRILKVRKIVNLNFIFQFVASTREYGIKNKGILPGQHIQMWLNLSKEL